MSIIDLGFTGARKGMTEPQRNMVYSIIATLKPRTFHHGDCIGADAEAHAIALELGIRIVKHPPSDAWQWADCQPADEIRPFAPYLVRNQHIVEETHALLATPATMEEVLRSGTWSTIRYARKIGREWEAIIIVLPDGTIE